MRHDRDEAEKADVGMAVGTRVICDDGNGVVWVNGHPIDGYVAENGISVADVANPAEVMTVQITVFASSVERVRGYRPRLYTEGDDPELVGLPARPGVLGQVDLTMPDLRGAL
ncbi:hypothetical protein SEA_NIBBLES_65 [Gordonia phage Nibbles]|nr:hypothetical protein SEA_NIBBLES_65 [Gordonia phage Nibbles]